MRIAGIRAGCSARAADCRCASSPSKFDSARSARTPPRRLLAHSGARGASISSCGPRSCPAAGERNFSSAMTSKPAACGTSGSGAPATRAPVRASARPGTGASPHRLARGCSAPSVCRKSALTGCAPAKARDLIEHPARGAAVDRRSGARYAIARQRRLPGDFERERRAEQEAVPMRAPIARHTARRVSARALCAASPPARPAAVQRASP